MVVQLLPELIASILGLASDSIFADRMCTMQEGVLNFRGCSLLQDGNCELIMIIFNLISWYVKRQGSVYSYLKTLPGTFWGLVDPSVRSWEKFGSFSHLGLVRGKHILMDM